MGNPSHPPDGLAGRDAAIEDILSLPAGPVVVESGCSIYRPADQAQAMLSRADTALYRAKRSGRNRVVIAGEPAPGEEVLW